MTSGGADVKLIFWEIACPGKARFRERWTHQSRVTAGGVEAPWTDDERDASRYRPSVSKYPLSPIPQAETTTPLTPFLGDRLPVASPAATPRLTTEHRVVQSGEQRKFAKRYGAALRRASSSSYRMHFGDRELVWAIRRRTLRLPD